MTNGKKSTLELRMIVCCALFTALIIIGGYISIPIPIGPVPIAMADFFVMLALFGDKVWVCCNCGIRGFRYAWIACICGRRCRACRFIWANGRLFSWIFIYGSNHRGDCRKRKEFGFAYTHSFACRKFAVVRNRCAMAENSYGAQLAGCACCRNCSIYSGDCNKNHCCNCAGSDLSAAVSSNAVA